MSRCFIMFRESWRRSRPPLCPSSVSLLVLFTLCSSLLSSSICFRLIKSRCIASSTGDRSDPPVSFSPLVPAPPTPTVPPPPSREDEMSSRPAALFINSFLNASVLADSLSPFVSRVPPRLFYRPRPLSGLALRFLSNKSG